MPHVRQTRGSWPCRRYGEGIPAYHLYMHAYYLLLHTHSTWDVADLSHVSRCAMVDHVGGERRVLRPVGCRDVELPPAFGFRSFSRAGDRTQWIRFM